MHAFILQSTHLPLFAEHGQFSVGTRYDLQIVLLRFFDHVHHNLSFSSPLLSPSTLSLPPPIPPHFLPPPLPSLLPSYFFFSLSFLLSSLPFSPPSSFSLLYTSLLLPAFPPPFLLLLSSSPLPFPHLSSLSFSPPDCSRSGGQTDQTMLSESDTKRPERLQNQQRQFWKCLSVL